MTPPGIEEPYHPVREIAGNLDAWYEWEERLGMWLADGITPTPADLAKLRNRILKRFDLAAAYQARKRIE